VVLRRGRPGSTTVEDKHLGRRYADLFFPLGEERGLIHQGTLKWR
jgi:hypothetical protein